MIWSHNWSHVLLRFFEVFLLDNKQNLIIIKFMNDVLGKLNLPIYTKEQLRELLKVSNVTLWKWGKAGIIREHKLGRHVYYIREEILEDLKRN